MPVLTKNFPSLWSTMFLKTLFISVQATLFHDNVNVSRMSKVYRFTEINATKMKKFAFISYNKAKIG